MIIPILFASTDIEHVSPWDLFLRSVGGGTSTRRSSVSLAPGLEDLVASSICSNLDRVMAMAEAEHFRETLGAVNFEKLTVKNSPQSLIGLAPYDCSSPRKPYIRQVIIRSILFV